MGYDDVQEAQEEEGASSQASTNARASARGRCRAIAASNHATCHHFLSSPIVLHGGNSSVRNASNNSLCSSSHHSLCNTSVCSSSSICSPSNNSICRPSHLLSRLHHWLRWILWCSCLNKTPLQRRCSKVVCLCWWLRLKLDAPK